MTPEQARAELARRELARRESAKQPKSSEQTQNTLNAGTVLSSAKNALSPIKAPVDLFNALRNDPKNVFDKGGGVLMPLAGAAVGGPVGAAGGEFLRQLVGTGLGSSNVPNTPMGSFASVVGQGVAAKPSILKAIPGVSSATKAVSSMASSLGRGAAKAAQAASGGKFGDFIDASKKGYSAYFAPSVKKAGEGISEAMKREGINPELTLEMALDPKLSVAEKTARTAGKALERGSKLGAEQSLKARQAIDRIIASTPEKDRTTLKALSSLRDKFNNSLAESSPGIKKASDIAREAYIKRTITSPFRLKKSGEMAATIPLMASVLGSGVGMLGGAESGAKAGLGAMALTSPLLYGGAATTAGQVAKLAANPAVRQLIVNALLGSGQNGR